MSVGDFDAKPPMAFPTTGEGYGNPHYSQHGMTLRDYFAGQALAGFAASPNACRTTWTDSSAAQSAYVAADAMLEARKVKP